MHLPLWSVVTLCTELVVTTLVYFIIYDATLRGVFRRGLAFGVLAYEALFNISYMTSRLLKGTHDGTAQIMTPYETGLAIFHGTFSFLMFIALVVFFIVAARAYARGDHYFRTHPRTTILFVSAWGISILSGVLFFFELYLL